MEKRIRIGIIIAFIIISLDVLVLGDDSGEESRESILTEARGNISAAVAKA